MFRKMLIKIFGVLFEKDNWKQATRWIGLKGDFKDECK
jgi:hypothetical protein